MAKRTAPAVLAVCALVGPVALYYALLVVLAITLQSVSFSHAAAMWMVAGVCATVAIVTGHAANSCYISEACQDILDFFACVAFWSAGTVVTYNVFVVWLNWHKVGGVLVGAAIFIFLASAYDYFRPAYRAVYRALRTMVKPKRAQEYRQPKRS